jgi:peptidyl-prolyl cis-trans isomerase C
MKHLRTLLPLAGLLGLVACQPNAGGGGAAAAAGGSSGPGAQPVATVNGAPITRDFYEYYVKQIAGRPSSELTPEQRGQVLDSLIRGELVEQQATKDGTLKNADTAALLELTRLNVLEQVVSTNYLKDKKPTEQEVRAEYETEVARMPRVEYHAKHILVATEPYAQKIIDSLEKGAKFDDLAKKESMDPNKDNGGDLGWFTPGTSIDKSFSDAVMGLKPGEYTHKPVQTSYGWHIIQLVDTREVAAQPFDSVRQRLEQIVSAKKFRAYTDELMRNAKIDKTLSDAKADEKKPEQKPEDKKG